MTIRALFTLAHKHTVLCGLAASLMSKGALVAATKGTLQAISTHPRYRPNMSDRLQPIHELAGYRETAGGAIKTLSPYVHAALQTTDLQTRVNHQLVSRIDLLCINLQKDDVGGVALILSAIKGGKIVVTNHEQVPLVLAALTPAGWPADTLEKMWTAAREMVHQSICVPQKSNVVSLRR